MFIQGRAKEAKAHIHAAHRVSMDMKSHVMEWYSLLISAYFLLKEDREKEGLLSLRKGLSLGNEYGYVHLEFYQPSVMRFLYAKALEEGIEQEYVKGLIRKLDLPPPSPIFSKEGKQGGAENWPYPIRIYTLGRFEIFINEKPMVFSKKVPKKPLALLKALIAFGGIDVAVNKITDALWPDADGDAASSSFKVNLHHLRKLLGREESVLTSERRISLNFQYCYVDVSAFAHIASAIMGFGTDAGKAEMKKLIPLAEKALEIYKGNFIEDDEGYPYIAVLRERLRSKFVHLVEMTGMYYEKQKQCHKAVELYEKGIETDEFQEEFYKRLMLCYKELGKHKEAVSAYNRCHRMLHIHFGVEPSIATKAVYEKIVAR
jgi:DNA-binding SARP family transcriptional activator